MSHNDDFKGLKVATASLRRRPRWRRAGPGNRPQRIQARHRVVLHFQWVSAGRSSVKTTTRGNGGAGHRPAPP